MDYVIGSVAALISSGNVTPNGPKAVKRALTPIKHKVSPNVTPKSELVGDRSIFLSPTLQKKKAILKKSPKRIFQDPNLDESNDAEMKSPKANKVKKHLENALDTNLNDSVVQTKAENSNSTNSNEKKAIEVKSLKKINKNKDVSNVDANETITSPNKNKLKVTPEAAAEEKENVIENESNQSTPSKKKNRKRKSSETVAVDTTEQPTKSPKKKQKNNATEDESAPIDKSQMSKSQKRRNRRINTKNKIKQEKAERAITGNKQSNNKANKNKLKKKLQKLIPDINIIAPDLVINSASIETKKKKTKLSEVDSTTVIDKDSDPDLNSNDKKKKKKQRKVESNMVTDMDSELDVNLNNSESKKKKKKLLKEDSNDVVEKDLTPEHNSDSKEKKKKKKKQKLVASDATENQDEITGNDSNDSESKPKKGKPKVNPNAITNKDSDSEHESDDDIESETEQANNEILNAGVEDSSEDEEDEEAKPESKKPKQKQQQQKKDGEPRVVDKEEVKRTLFVGNVPFSKKTKKDIKKIFVKYGDIDTVRMRTIPVADARTTPKLAVIKNELHPERTTVNCYVKFKNAASVDKALVENNTLFNENHLRVSRSETTGAHDTSMSVFVGNLPFALEEEALRSKFLACGAIADVRIVRDRITNVGKGFGYVNFESKDAVELALQMTEEDLTIKNRIIRVKRCTTNAQKPNQNQGNQMRSKFNNQRQNQNWAQRPNGPQKFGRQGNDQNEGAYRRIMNKRPHQDGEGGPPSKRANGPPREKKARKEFVGVTAEKKKKQKFNKGQKKKKVLSEILTK